MSFLYVALGALGGVMWERGRKPRCPVSPAREQAALPPSQRPVVVGAQCSSWSVLDQGRVALVFRYVYADQRLRGIADPFVIANGVMESLAPECRVWGMQPRNMGELDLYVEIWEDVAKDLRDDAAVTPVEMSEYQKTLLSWYATQQHRLTGQGVP